MPDRWFHLEEKAPGHLAIIINGDISREGSEEFFGELRALLPTNHIELHMNSWGVDAIIGLGVHNTIASLAREGAQVCAHVEGVAGSIAAVMAMAAQEILVPEEGFMFVHPPAREDGSSDSMVEMFGGAIARIYAQRTGRTPGEIKTLIEGDTWMNGREACWQGFADTNRFSRAELSKLRESHVEQNAESFSERPARGA